MQFSLVPSISQSQNHKDMGLATESELLLRAIDLGFIKRRETGNIVRVAAFAKRMMIASIHVPPEVSESWVETIKALQTVITSF